jgi:hypothetical protein
MYYLKHEHDCFVRYKTRERSWSVFCLIKHGAASVLNSLKNDPSDEFIGEGIFEINVV